MTASRSRLWPTRRTVRAVALVLVALNLTGGLLLSVLALRHAADKNRQTRIALTQLQTDATELAHQIALSGLPGIDRPAAETRVRAAGRDVRAGLVRVVAMLPPGPPEARLKRRLTALPAGVPSSEGYSAARSRRAAASADHWLERVLKQTDPLSAQEQATADRNSRLADIETALLMLTGLIVVVSLFRGFDRARRAADLRAAAERSRSEARFRALVTHSSDLTMVVDVDGTVKFRSPAVRRLLAAPTGTAGRHVTDLIVEEDRQAFMATLSGLVAGAHEGVKLVGRWRGRDGAPLWIEAELSDLRANTDIAGIVINGHDITDARQLEDQLRRQAFSDPLTGLANRALFTDRLEQALLAARRTGRPVALAYLDLDGFKQVNDGSGHVAGDELLLRVGEALTGAARSGDTVARLGGDEFAVLAPELAADELATFAAELLAAVRAAGAHTSLGVAGTDELVVDGEDLVRRADLAMYNAKGRGGDCVVVFEPRLHSAALERAQLRGDLASAVERDELRVFYQPVIALSDERIVGAEALLRWQHPERGTVSPVVFVPVAEESQDIIAFGRWVLRRACRQAQEWQRHQGERGIQLHLAVNVSVTQLRDPDILDDVRAALQDTGWPASALTLEVTESQFIADGDEGIIGVLQDLRALGCRIAIDDFGTGYSSLSYLERLPADILKIDRSFVQRVVTSREAQVLVEGIVNLAHGLGMSIVAEGVEERAQADLLRELGCGSAQGFLWGRPLTVVEFEARLRAGEHRRHRQQALLLEGV